MSVIGVYIGIMTHEVIWEADKKIRHDAVLYYLS